MQSFFVKRILSKSVLEQLNRSKSVLLLGPRQTGKSTMLSQLGPWDLELSFLIQATRIRYERNPDRLIEEVKALGKVKPRILIDEVQKIPSIMDVIQHLIDKQLGIFVLTGSSTRKLKTADAINLLPGRLVVMHLDPFSLEEYPDRTIEELLLYGSLPAIVLEQSRNNKAADLASYVGTYLDEEVRKEALVRNVPAFSRFLELAAIDSGRISNLTEISKHVGVTHATLGKYYQILQDCLLVERIEPITKSDTRKKLTRSPRFVFFDLGIRRLAADEGEKLNPERMGELFEQFVALELLRSLRSRMAIGARVNFWRDPDGPEVDWVLNAQQRWIPLEVKWSADPTPADARHLEVFIKEYKCQAQFGYVICQTERAYQLTENVRAISWREIPRVVEEFLK